MTDMIRTNGFPVFGRIPRELLRDSSVSRDARLLWVTLEDYTSKDGEAPWPSQETLAEHLGCTDRTVRTYQTELETAGWLVVEHRAGRSNLYHLNWSPFLEVPRKPASAPPRKSASGDPGNQLPTKKNQEEEPDEENSLVGDADASADDDVFRKGAEFVLGAYAEANSRPRQKVTKTAIRDMRLLMQRGPTTWDTPAPVSKQEIGRIVAATMRDRFWRKQIQSPGNLREHWDRLTVLADEAEQLEAGVEPELPELPLVVHDGCCDGSGLIDTDDGMVQCRGIERAA